MNEPKQNDPLLDAIKDSDPKKVAQYANRASITELHVQTALDILAESKNIQHAQVSPSDATIEAMQKSRSEENPKDKAASAQAIVAVLQEMASDAVLDAIDANHARKFQKQRDQDKGTGGPAR